MAWSILNVVDIILNNLMSAGILSPTKKQYIQLNHRNTMKYIAINANIKFFLIMIICDKEHELNVHRKEEQPIYIQYSCT